LLPEVRTSSTTRPWPAATPVCRCDREDSWPPRLLILFLGCAVRCLSIRRHGWFVSTDPRAPRPHGERARLARSPRRRAHHDDGRHRARKYTHNTLITCCRGRGLYMEAAQVFGEMKASGFEPDPLYDATVIHRVCDKLLLILVCTMCQLVNFLGMCCTLFRP
jgi:pentatricopeptide repeat protein